VNTPFFKKGSNLFDYTKFNHDNNYLNQSNGSLVSNAEYKTTDYIEVKPNTNYVGNYTNHICYYDEGYNFISGTNQIFSATTPLNAKYVRFDWHKGDIPESAIMFVEGYTLPTKYEPAYVPTYPITNNNANSQWNGKKWVAYGDSITAISNGNELNNGWAKYVNDKYDFAGFYGRGIGGQKFSWGTNGGSVSFINNGGTFNSRNDNYNKDNYNGAIPQGTTACRGAFCSWDRITQMIPETIKDTIDLIYIMGGTNDSVDNTEVEWVENDATDTEWVASAYYSAYGGDFNISTLKGGVASTIMKMQAWCPNAIIVIGTPLSGSGANGVINKNIVTNEYEKSQIIKDVTSKMSIPTIDINATCGINGFNRLVYITDEVHPYSEDGKKMLARAVIGGFRTIEPNI
jgi:hypothetical protein